MKHSLLFLLLYVTGPSFLGAQGNGTGTSQQKAIARLIDQYAEAREKSDTTLLRTILTADIDQLVSTGEWRRGVGAALEGMLKSSATNEGTRTLHVENMHMLTPSVAIADCRYEIERNNGTTRRMWSTFIVVVDKGAWKIAAIRNMLPAPQ